MSVFFLSVIMITLVQFILHLNVPREGDGVSELLKDGFYLAL